MNTVKYRPVGSAGPIKLVRIRRRAKYISREQRPTKKQADAAMLRMGYIRAGVRKQ